MLFHDYSIKLTEVKRFQIFSSPYQAVNVLTGMLIVFILGYSAFYGQDHRDHPVECVHVAINGQECSTCGLSQSFSLMIRGNYSPAMEYNRNGPLLFGFFAVQLFLRTFAGTVIYLVRRRKFLLPVTAIAWSDGVLSLALFLVCFRFLLVFW